MAEKKEMIPKQYDIDAKWDACIDLTVRRFVYSASAGAFGGLLFFSQYFLSLVFFVTLCFSFGFFVLNMKPINNFLFACLLFN